MSDELPRYFGGPSVKDNRVSGIKAKDFPELVTRFFHNSVRIPLIRKEFLALDEKPQKEAKDVDYITPCRFKSDPDRRDTVNATEMVLAFIDVDGGDTARKIQEDPSVVIEALHPFNAVVYKTARYTEADPRYRIVVDLEGCDPKDYKRVIRYLSGRLGFPDEWDGAKESRVVVQPMYRPVVFAGDKSTPVVCARVTGIALPIEEVPPADDEWDELLEGKTYSLGPADPEILGLGYLPKAGIVPEDIRDPLFAIDPDVVYTTWIQVIAACRHQFRGEEEAKEAFELLVEWSSQGTKYSGEKEVWAKWRSFRPDAAGRAPVTVATLFKLAIDAGWNSTRLATRLKGTTVEWIATCEDSDELMKEGPARIAALPFRNEVVEDSLVLTLRDRLKGLTGQTMAKASIQHEVVRARKREAAGKREERGVDPMPEFLAPMVYVATEDRFRHCGTGVSYTPGAFDRLLGRELMPKDPAEVPADGKPPVLPSNYALNIVKIPTVDETLYYPLGGGEERFVEVGDRIYLNTYNPLSPPSANPEFSEEAGALFCKLVGKVVGNPLYESILLDFWASNTQFPGLKICWVPLLQSVEGAGKGMICDSLRAVLGKINVRTTPPEVVNEKYNDHYVVGAVLNIWNEIHIPGERRARVTNALKQPITDDTVVVIQKYCDPREVLNMVNHMAFTNVKGAIHLDPGDRRWMIIFSPMQDKDEAQALADSGFYEQFDILQNEWAGALRYWLLRRRIAADFPYKGPAPITEFRQEVIDEGINPVETAIRDLIDDPDECLVGPDVISTAHMNQMLSRETKNRGAKPTHYLSQLGYRKWTGMKSRPVLAGRRTDIWYHPGRFIDGIESPLETLDRRVAANGNLIDI